MIVHLEIDDEKVGFVTELGFIWSSTEDTLTIDNTKGLLIATDIVEENRQQLDNLQPNLKYKVRAYALTHNSLYYSDHLTFTTVDKDGVVGTVTDIDGNVYKTMIYGGNEWMVENLKVTRYQNGLAINTDIADANWGSPFFGWIWLLSTR